jgi:hypothetical protein
MQGLLYNLNALRLSIQEASNLSEEDRVIVAHMLASLYSDSLEQLKPGASTQRNETYVKNKKKSEAAECSCGGKQVAVYHIGDDKDVKVCQQCYRKHKKRQRQ